MRKSKEAVFCEECQRWQHRTCGTGITRAAYLAGIRDGYIDWTCNECVRPVPEEPAAQLDVFAGDLGAFEEPAVVEEQNLPNPYRVPNPDIPVGVEDEVTFKIFEATSIRGKDTLTSSDGYQYTKKVDRRRPNNVTWRCCVRNRNLTCRATVIERDGVYIRGLQNHICGAMPGLEKVSIIRRNVKEQAVNRPFESTSEMVEKILRDEIGEGNVVLHPTLPTPRNLARQANLKRKLTRPNQPNDLYFDLDENHIAPGFLQGDVLVDGGWHIIFSTPNMMDMLRNARTWYVDGTFKLIRDPFYQLFSIHSFITHGTSMKQVPLLFAVMSGKRMVDYTAVLRAVIDLLPATNVEKIVTDFEASIWQAIREVMPLVRVSGCLFHYSQVCYRTNWCLFKTFVYYMLFYIFQAVYRKVQELGLTRAYRADPATNMTIRQLMALPVLPLEHIDAVFRELEQLDGGVLALADLMMYMRTTLIQGNVFSPEDWVVYRQNIRTNNDLEGWHRRLNNRAKRANIPFYLLCELLYEEAVAVGINAELVFREDNLRVQTTHAAATNARLSRMWQEYSDGQRSVHSLLTTASRLL
ncbi:uncharacterized protein [Antedon mediterranea]|uniref:uncharacterized protein n=1 Tax=Antedon mediterranea TaxID=105859 RepID=UPI003AF5EE72